MAELFSGARRRSPGLLAPLWEIVTHTPKRKQHAVPVLLEKKHSGKISTKVE